MASIRSVLRGVQRSVARSVVRTAAVSGVVNQPPVVNITSKVGQVWTAVATDVEDGTISANVVWTSDLDGALGTGATVDLSATLSTGGWHTITATITDSGMSSAADADTAFFVANTVTAWPINDADMGQDFKTGAGHDMLVSVDATAATDQWAFPATTALGDEVIGPPVGASTLYLQSTGAGFALEDAQETALPQYGGAPGSIYWASLASTAMYDVQLEPIDVDDVGSVFVLMRGRTNELGTITSLAVLSNSAQPIVPGDGRIYISKTVDTPPKFSVSAQQATGGQSRASSLAYVNDEWFLGMGGISKIANKTRVSVVTSAGYATIGTATYTPSGSGTVFNYLSLGAYPGGSPVNPVQGWLGDILVVSGVGDEGLTQAQLEAIYDSNLCLADAVRAQVATARIHLNLQTQENNTWLDTVSGRSLEFRSGGGAGNAEWSSEVFNNGTVTDRLVANRVAADSGYAIGDALEFDRTNYLELIAPTVPPTGAAPLSIYMSFAPTLASETNSIMSISDGSTSDRFCFYLTAGNLWLQSTGAFASVNRILVGAPFTSGVFSNVVGSIAANDDWAIRVDSTETTGNNAYAAPSGINSLSLGTLISGVGDTAGKIGLWAIWDVALNLWERQALGAGVHPLLIRPTNITRWGYVSGGVMIDVVEGDTFTVTGTPVSTAYTGTTNTSRVRQHDYSATASEFEYGGMASDLGNRIVTIDALLTTDYGSAPDADVSPTYSIPAGVTWQGGGKVPGGAFSLKSAGASGRVYVVPVEYKP